MSERKSNLDARLNRKPSVLTTRILRDAMNRASRCAPVEGTLPQSGAKMPQSGAPSDGEQIDLDELPPWSEISPWPYPARDQS
jgi:hypothetical protein